MKILGGIAKGRKLSAPKGVDTRPVLARVRNSLFNILRHRLVDKRVIDLFAGTGSLGLEALSRGAKFCLFVENNRKCLEMINQNIKALGFTDYASTVLLNSILRDTTKDEGFRITSYLMNKSLSFDIIFVAPPYKFFKDLRLKQKLINCLEELVRYSLLDKDGLIIMEHRRHQIQNNEFNLLTEVDHRSYGQTELTFLQRKVQLKPS